MYDLVAHCATSFSRIHRTTVSLLEGMDTIPARLKALRNQAAPRMSSRKLAAALGMPDSTYAAYEDPKKFKKPILPLDLAKRIADALADRGVPRSDVMLLAGVTGELMKESGRARLTEDSEWVQVTGTVAAGVWREQSDWSASEYYEVRFGPPPFAGAERFGLRMEGLSMNKTIPPGSDLECLRIGYSSVRPEVGSLVIVARNAHDLTELTCKRLEMEEDQYVLRCESTEPEFQEIIPIGQPDSGMFTDTEVRVIAIVLSAKQDLAPRGLGTRRFR